MKRNTLLSMIVCMLLCATMLIAPMSIAAYASGSGTEADPYIISSLPFTESKVIEQGTDSEGKPIYNGGKSIYYQVTAPQNGKMTVTITGDCAFTVVQQNGSQVTGMLGVTTLDVAEGDNIAIEVMPYAVGTTTLNITIEDFPLGSRQNPISLDFSQLEDGFTFDLTQERSLWYEIVAPQDGVLKFSSTDMPWGFALGFNGNTTTDVATVIQHYNQNGTRPISAGETFLLCAEYGAAEPGKFSVKVTYVPPFTIDEATQKTMFNGMYQVKSGDGRRMVGVEFNYDAKTVSVVDSRDPQQDVFFGTYDFNYNLKNGALELTKRGEKAPFTISVIEDASADLGAYLKFDHNGSYNLTALTEDDIKELKPSEATTKLLNGRYEDVYEGVTYETFKFDYATQTVTVAETWEDERVTYTMTYSVFSGNLTLVSADGRDTRTMSVQNGEIIYMGLPLVKIHDHDYTYRTNTVYPTCETDGYTTYTCECGDSYTDNAVPATGHNMETEVVAPTCTEGGYTISRCTNCWKSETTDEVPALGHSNEAVVTAPTCTEGGYTTFTCTVCGEVSTGDETAALGHAYKSVVTNPTCTEGGYTTHTCSACGDEKVDSQTSATGHSFGNWTDNGDNHKKTCSACGLVETADHAWDDGVVIKEATEDVDGEKKLTCTDCAATKIQIIPSLAHTHKFTGVVTDPTCTEAGYTTFTCGCGETYTEAGAAALGHSYKDVITKPTCTEGGYTTHTCTVCGYEKVDSQTNAAGHSYKDVVTKPTCTEGGYTTSTCSVCGDEKVGSHTEATGHNYEGVLEGIMMTYTCTVCGHSYSEPAQQTIQVPGNLTGLVNGSKEYLWTSNMNGNLTIDKAAANLVGASITVTINGEEAQPTEEGYAVKVGDEVRIVVTTFYSVEINIPISMGEGSFNPDVDSPMEFELNFSGANGAEEEWRAPITGKLTFIISASDLNGGLTMDGVTFRVIDAADNWYNHYDEAFGLDANGNHYITLEVTEGDTLKIVAYANDFQSSGKLSITVIEGEPEVHEHTFDEGVRVEPTCTKNGYITYTCTVCGEKVLEKLDKLGHTEEIIPGKEATCTETGLTEGKKCSVCGEITVEQTATELGEHTYGEWETVKEATATEAGSRKRACTVCGAEQTEEIPATGEEPTQPVQPTEPDNEPTEPGSEPTTPATEPNATEPNGNEGGNSTVIIIVIVAVVLVAGGAVAFIVIKKKK